MDLTILEHRSCRSIVTDRCRVGIKRQNGGQRRLTTPPRLSRLERRRDHARIQHTIIKRKFTSLSNPTGGDLVDSFSPPPPISSQALFGTLLFASRVLSSPPFLSVSRETLLPRGPSSRDLRPITDHRLEILAPSPLPRNRTPWNPSLSRILLDIQIGFKLSQPSSKDR